MADCRHASSHCLDDQEIVNPQGIRITRRSDQGRYLNIFLSREQRRTTEDE